MIGRMMPEADTPVPEPVTGIAGRRPVTIVWQNELGGPTCRVGAGPDRIFVKWNPVSSGIDLTAEAERLVWAIAYTPVPRVLDHRRIDGAELLVTAGVPGECAVEDRWKADPATAVAGIGAGLRAFHDRVPVAACPYSWTAPDRLAEAHAALRAEDAARFHTYRRTFS